MKGRLQGILRLMTLGTACTVAWSAAGAQGAPPNPLRDQIAAQYKPAKITFGAQGATVNDPGAVLVVQMEGIVAVPHGSTACPVTYKDGALQPPGASCTAPAKDRRKFQLQDKVYLSKLSVSRANDTVTMAILACESCSGAPKSSYNQGEIIFQYPKGYLASADPGQIEDVIATVLSIYNSADDAKQQTQAASSGTPGVLGNADVIKLVKAGLPETLIISKIKSASCDFDTSPDALIKLKGAGVSDKILEAMVQAPSASAIAAAAQQAAAAPAPTGCGDYGNCMAAGKAAAGAGSWDEAIADYQQAAQLNGTTRDPLDQLALAYLTLGRNQELNATLDRILQIGQPVIVGVCRERAMGCEGGTFILSANEISFHDLKNQVVFVVPPGQVGMPEAKQHLPANGDAPYFAVHVAGKVYNFDVFPPSGSCAVQGSLLKCPPEGIHQQVAVDHYVVYTIKRLSGGGAGQ